MGGRSDLAKAREVVDFVKQDRKYDLIWFEEGRKPQPEYGELVGSGWYLVRTCTTELIRSTAWHPRPIRCGTRVLQRKCGYDVLSQALAETLARSMTIIALEEIRICYPYSGS